MADRIQINEEDIEQVVGGAFNFFTSKKTGEMKCYVDGIGTYTCPSSTAKDQLSVMCARNPGLSQQELLDRAIANGWLY